MSVLIENEADGQRWWPVLRGYCHTLALCSGKVQQVHTLRKWDFMFTWRRFNQLVTVSTRNLVGWMKGFIATL